MVYINRKMIRIYKSYFDFQNFFVNKEVNSKRYLFRYFFKCVIFSKKNDRKRYLNYEDVRENYGFCLCSLFKIV